MTLHLTAESLWSVFRTTALLTQKRITAIKLSFPKNTENVKAEIELSSISENEISQYFDDLMKKSFRIKNTEAATIAETNVYKFHAEGFSFVKKWIEVMPQGLIRSITITFQGISGVEVLAHMQDHIKLNDMREYLQRVYEGQAMWESVQRPQHYTGDCNSFLGIINHAEIFN